MCTIYCTHIPCLGVSTFPSSSVCYSSPPPHQVWFADPYTDGPEQTAKIVLCCKHILDKHWHLTLPFSAVDRFSCSDILSDCKRATYTNICSHNACLQPYTRTSMYDVRMYIQSVLYCTKDSVVYSLFCWMNISHKAL